MKLVKKILKIAVVLTAQHTITKNPYNTVTECLCVCAFVPKDIANR